MWAPKDRTPTVGGLVWHRAGGRGAPVVLIHGVGLRLDAWTPQIEALQGDFRVHAIDLPGHGHSPLLQEPSTGFRAFADTVAAAVTTIGEPAHLVGHSLGALVALDVAESHPHLCLSVAAISAIYRRTAAARAAVLRRANSLSGGDTGNVEETLARWFGTDPAGSLSACARACRGWLSSADPKGYAAAYRLFADHDGPSDAALRGLPMPVLFLTGEGDPNSTPAMSRAMASLAPEGYLSVINGAAHMVTMTHPKETNAVLGRFLAGTPPTKDT